MHGLNVPLARGARRETRHGTRRYLTRYESGPQIRKSYEREDKKNNVLLMSDYLPQSNINWLYKNSDIFALFRRGEGSKNHQSEKPPEGGVYYLVARGILHVDPL